MSTRFLTDKSLASEGRFSGFLRDDALGFAEPGVGPAWPPDRSCVLRHVTLRLDVDPRERRYQGEAELVVASLPGRSGPWTFDLEELDVHAVTVDGAPVPFRVAGGALEVDAPSPAATLTVRFSGAPRLGLYVVEAPGQRPAAWTQCQDTHARHLFPCHDHPSRRAGYTVEVRAPLGYTVVGNGRLAGRVTEGEHERWTWEQAEPIPAYLFTLVVMDAVVVEDAGPVPLRYLAPAGTDPAVMRRVFGKTPEMVAMLAEDFGPFPWARYDQVVVPEFVFGGMENVAATTLIDTVLTDERVALDWDAEDLLVHELAHQWFGDLVTCEDWSEGWLNESWATLIESRWFRRSRGPLHAEWCRFEQWSQYLDEAAGRYRRAIVSRSFRVPIDLFDRHLYEKGAIVLHMLGERLGEAHFLRGVRRYLDTHRLGGVHTRDFQRALEAETGRSLEAFFDQHVLRPGHPVLQVSITRGAEGLVLNVSQTQSGEGIPEVYRLDLPVLVDGRPVRIALGERRQRVHLTGSAVVIDPDFALAAEIRLDGSDRELLLGALGAGGPVARVRVARALGQEDHPSARAALRRALAEDPWWGVRAEIAGILAESPDAQDLAALVAARGDVEPRARRAVARALGRTRSPEAVAALGGWGAEPSLLVEAEVIEALGETRAPEALPRARAKVGEAGWMGLPATRALVALGASRSLDVLPELLAATEVGRPTRVRAAACAALGRLAGEVPAARLAAVERLAALTRDPLFRVKLAAVNALGATKDPAAEAPLRRAHDARGDGRVRRMAFEALRRLGNADADGLGALRRSVEALGEDGRRLRDRLARLEGGWSAS